MMIGAANYSNGDNYYQMYTAFARNDGADPKVGGATGAEGASEGECRTCAERKYVDGSDDAGVSFKTPTNISPEQAASAVVSHEMEHVSREQSKADAEGREVVRQSVKIHMDVCPECGRSYVSGGTTTTVTAADQDKNKKAEEPGKGINFDKIA